MNTLTLGSLFDGSGGFPLAGTLNGITPVWASEIEPYPIAMPYCPPNRPYKVYTEEFLFEARNGDFDTVYIHYIRTPEGDKVDVNRMFTTPEDGRGWKEITPEELDRLKAAK